MKTLLLSLALLGFTSCLGSRARDRVLPPAISLLWEEVQVDYNAGLDQAVYQNTMGPETRELMDDLGAQLTSAIEGGDRAAFLIIPWETSMRQFALLGIQIQLSEELIGPNGAALLTEQVTKLTELLRAVVISSAVPSLETFSRARYLYDTTTVTSEGKPRRVAFTNIGG